MQPDQKNSGCAVLWRKMVVVMTTILNRILLVTSSALTCPCPVQEVDPVKFRPVGRM
jgi:hypothetical protein